MRSLCIVTAVAGVIGIFVGVMNQKADLLLPEAVC